MNGILRNIPIKNRDVAKEEVLKGGLGEVINTPHDKDKDGLFKTMFEATKLMNTQKEI